MAREHARILARIWDPGSEFRNLGPDAQRLYFMLLSQRSLNHAGVLQLSVKKWANNSAGTSTEDIWTALKELAAARYVVVDEETEEVLIRTFIRNDGVARQPNVLKAALRLSAGLESPLLRAVLAGELRKLDSEHAHRVADALVGASPEPPPEPPSNPSPKGSGKGSGNPLSTVDNPVDKNPSGNPSGTPREPFARNAGEGVGEGGSVTSFSGQVLKKGAGAKSDRPDDRCTKHSHVVNPPPCRGCAAARQASENYDEQHHRATSAAIHACAHCDGDGWRWDPAGKHRGVLAERCDHRPAERRVAS